MLTVGVIGGAEDVGDGECDAGEHSNDQINDGADQLQRLEEFSYSAKIERIERAENSRRTTGFSDDLRFQRMTM